MTRFLRLAASVFIVAAGACSRTAERGADAASSRTAPVEIGSPAPAYSAVTLAGDSASLDQLRGKVVLLNIWATWCRPCREEIPVLVSLHDRHAARGLSVIGVSVDAQGEEAAIRDFATDMHMPYAIWIDPEERVSATYLAIGVPATYLIDRRGTLRWRHVGPISPRDTVLTAAIEQALGESAGTP